MKNQQKYNNKNNKINKVIKQFGISVAKIIMMNLLTVKNM